MGAIVELSSDLNVITAEINAYQRVAGEAIFEIGRRLKHVKENDLAHGEFGRWLEQVDIDRTLATRLMKVANEFDGKYATSHKLGINTLYEIATMSPDQRDKPHRVPSTGATKTPDEMTVRELREVKKALKEAQERAQQAEQDYECIRQAFEAVGEREQSEEVYDVIRIDDSEEINGSALQFAETIRDLIKRYAYLQNYGGKFASMNDLSRNEYEGSLDALISFATSIRKQLQFTRHGDIIIEMEEF